MLLLRIHHHIVLLGIINVIIVELKLLLLIRRLKKFIIKIILGIYINLMRSRSLILRWLVVILILIPIHFLLLILQLLHLLILILILVSKHLLIHLCFDFTQHHLYLLILPLILFLFVDNRTCWKITIIINIFVYFFNWFIWTFSRINTLISFAFIIITTLLLSLIEGRLLIEIASQSLFFLSYGNLICFSLIWNFLLLCLD